MSPGKSRRAWEKEGLPMGPRAETPEGANLTRPGRAEGSLICPGCAHGLVVADIGLMEGRWGRINKKAGGGVASPEAASRPRPQQVLQVRVLRLQHRQVRPG